MDKYKIDSHKLMYHVNRVSAWLNDEMIYPIYIEISPIGACNHRCSFCGLDFMKYQNRKLNSVRLIKVLEEVQSLGVKSVMFAGEGEPLLHKKMGDIARCGQRAGLDISFTTNGVFLKGSLAQDVIASSKWIKISFNAGTAETYAKIHRTKTDDFHNVLENLKHAVAFRESNYLNCTLGMQALLLPENEHEIVPLAQMAGDIGMDYLVVKPFSQHPQSHAKKYGNLQYEQFMYLAQQLQQYQSESFKVFFRANTMQKWDHKERSYKQCLALPFWSYIDAGGNVWGCSMFLNDDKFLYGNVLTSSFKDIWEGSKRAASLSHVKNCLNVSNCRINCRMDQINEYLWELKHPSPHVNFI